ncbi:hypothetical protein A1O3_00833 [Capronia epimyces CBS 606.96]|uniref:Uncharacterized protein n=1 Tax=Capronia epimyces CBS 606.96 TaxID=1182542 RepID=W9YIB3_9EURO|nr:uncharacterized protein A1O3_00833 [Capronia epimyces CBS 606.96]EXJ92283.1 hypothetical protein A1O3_00833 [Capronia epimyces CBS 606.96]
MAGGDSGKHYRSIRDYLLFLLISSSPSITITAVSLTAVHSNEARLRKMAFGIDSLLSNSAKRVTGMFSALGVNHVLKGKEASNNLGLCTSPISREKTKTQCWLSFRGVICDEGHKLGEFNSTNTESRFQTCRTKNAVAVKKLYMSKKWIVTATPMINRVPASSDISISSGTPVEIGPLEIKQHSALQCRAKYQYWPLYLFDTELFASLLNKGLLGGGSLAQDTRDKKRTEISFQLNGFYPDYAEKVSAANKACREKNRDELNATEREVRAAKKVTNAANSAGGQGSLDGFLHSSQDSTGRKQIQTLEAPTSHREALTDKTAKDNRLRNARWRQAPDGHDHTEKYSEWKRNDKAKHFLWGMQHKTHFHIADRIEADNAISSEAKIDEDLGDILPEGCPGHEALDPADNDLHFCMCLTDPSFSIVFEASKRRNMLKQRTELVQYMEVHMREARRIVRQASKEMTPRSQRQDLKHTFSKANPRSSEDEAYLVQCKGTANSELPPLSEWVEELMTFTFSPDLSIMMLTITAIPLRAPPSLISTQIVASTPHDTLSDMDTNATGLKDCKMFEVRGSLLFATIKVEGQKLVAKHRRAKLVANHRMGTALMWLLWVQIT